MAKNVYCITEDVDKGALDDVGRVPEGCESHELRIYEPVLNLKATNKVVNSPVNVSNQNDWQTVGGTVTTLTAFMKNPNKAWGRLIGRIITEGAGAQMRVIRESDGLICGGPFDLPDTDGNPQVFQDWVKDNQPSTTECFLIQARLNGATSLSVAYFTISLFKADM